MSYQTAISGLDWQMVPSGMTVPPGGIAAMQQYEQGMGAIIAGNNVGYINANLTSGDYNGTIADIVYDTIMVTGTIATNRNINLYFNSGTQNGVKRYFVILTPQASSGGPFIVTITTGTGTTVIVPIAASGDTLTSPDLQIEITVDPSGNVRSASFIVSGSNSNGSWVKLANHTMRSWGSYDVTIDTLDATSTNMFGTTAGNYYYDSPYTTHLFPVQFSTVPVVTATATVYMATEYDPNAGVDGKTYIKIVALSGKYGQTGAVNWNAEGYW